MCTEFTVARQPWSASLLASVCPYTLNVKFNKCRKVYMVLLGIPQNI